MVNRRMRKRAFCEILNNKQRKDKEGKTHLGSTLSLVGGFIPEWQV
jgi:hypothetical protein